jgi:hypothetical protein
MKRHSKGRRGQPLVKMRMFNEPLGKLRVDDKIIAPPLFIASAVDG